VLKLAKCLALRALTCAVVSAANTDVDRALTCAEDIPEMCEACSVDTSPTAIAAISVVVHDDTGFDAAGIAAKLTDE
jgi:hypothetical protein